MWVSPIFERFVQKSPVTVMVRTLMEVVLAPSKLDKLFEETAQTGYTKEILFSTLVSMMAQVTCSVRQSMGAVYKDMASELGVSFVGCLWKAQSFRTFGESSLTAIQCLRNGRFEPPNRRVQESPVAQISPQNSRW